EDAEMAAQWPTQLTDEATCSICLDYFKDPVIIPECGHNFCKTCLDRYWGKSSSKVSCPHCRMMVQRKMVTPNRPLANLIELAKKLALRGEKRARDEGNICDKHQEPQKLFCQDDKVLLCVVCDRSKEHRSHQVIPLEEAFDECKVGMPNGY
uniref:RING-type E3 ubiquitin transferase n=1 Tax=Salvator merianae TaxID=96440 RepID=A0A8D0KDI2_SALMN